MLHIVLHTRGWWKFSLVQISKKYFAGVIYGQKSHVCSLKRNPHTSTNGSLVYKSKFVCKEEVISSNIVKLLKHNYSNTISRRLWSHWPFGRPGRRAVRADEKQTNGKIIEFENSINYKIDWVRVGSWVITRKDAIPSLPCYANRLK